MHSTLDQWEREQDGQFMTLDGERWRAIRHDDGTWSVYALSILGAWSIRYEFPIDFEVS